MQSFRKELIDIHSLFDNVERITRHLRARKARKVNDILQKKNGVEVVAKTVVRANPRTEVKS